ncbi:MAG: type II secretion system protein [Kiritimatiellia bacterium]
MRYKRKAFTLVELLLVISIIGIMAFVVGPSVFTGSDLMRLKTASRGVVQLSRYSKTMALLHQTPVDLVFSSDGKIRVKKAGHSGDSLVSADSFSETNRLDSAEPEPEEIETPGIIGENESDDSAGEEYVMADLELEKEYEQVSFRFEGYTDSIDGSSELDHSFSATSPDDAAEEAVTTFTIHYRSNGTCRPHRIRIIAGENEMEYRIVSVNVLGRAEVEKGDEW